MSIMHEYVSQQESTAYDILLELLKRKGFHVPRVHPFRLRFGAMVQRLERGMVMVVGEWGAGTSAGQSTVEPHGRSG